MALPSTRMDFRIDLSHVDRGREASERVIVARHPSESAEHVMLRVLAYCLFHEEGLAFGPGLADAEGADLWTRDPAGRVLTWIECGAAPFEKLKRIVQHNAGVAVHALFSDARRRDELVSGAREAASRASKVTGAISLSTVDHRLVAALAENTGLRRQWAVTIVGDHLYIEADGRTLDGEVVRSRLEES
ncbi:YaeQ family protein [Sorangium sp. So ce726]|uniref:YaeQ family protein n=1 Tax=Sorangium sp. So ce726 TaxID=3133319 RepID=UPI003F63F817